MTGTNAGTCRRISLSIVAVLAFGFVAVSGASASLAVGPGSTFSTSYIDLPEGALPGGDSGIVNSNVDRSSLSSNGRYLAFDSDVNSMSADANPDYTNVFRKDRQTGAVELVSRATGATGAAPAGNSFQPRISADGNLVSFITTASLNPADVDGKQDVYVRNLTTKATILATPDTTDAAFQYDLSANGLYIVFASAEQVLPGVDANAVSDVYRRNLFTGVVELVSRKAGSPNAGSEASLSPAISGDGRWVTYESDENNLVAPFTDNNGNGSDDVFARDMNTNTNYLVSSKNGGFTTGANGRSYSPAIAGTPAAIGDVRVSFDSDATDIAALDISPSASIYQGRATNFNSILISRQTNSEGGLNANSRANGSEMSDDGNLVFFSTDATNLDPAPEYYGAYVRNISAGTTKMRSNDNEYAIAADISGDGSRVAWSENGGFTPDSDKAARSVFTRPAGGGAPEFTSRQPGNAPVIVPGAAYVESNYTGRAISADGRYVAFIAASNRLPGGSKRNQAFRRDLSTGEIELASRDTGANGAVSEFGGDTVSISSDGSRVAFAAYASLDPVADSDDKTDIYVRDFSNDTTTLASRADGPAGAAADEDVYDPMISGDGKRITFSTDASNMGTAGGTAQVFVRDLASNRTILVSRDNSADPGVEGDDDSDNPAISADGEVIAFESRATNLDPDDAVNNRDIFVRNLATNKTTLVSRQGGLAGATTLGFKRSPAISSDGKIVVFEAEDQPIAPEAGAWPVGSYQVVSRVLATGANALVSRAPGGAAADESARDSSISGDGSVIAFESSASNLKPGLGGPDHRTVFARQSASGAISAPPDFGQPDNGQGSNAPSISENGQCLAFGARGFNSVSGDLSDLQGTYVHVVSGTCLDPRQNEIIEPPVASKPKLSRVKLTNKKFRVAKKPTAKVAKSKKKRRKKKSPKGTRIKFNLDVNASVTIKFQKKTKGRKYKGKCRKFTRKTRRKKKCQRYVTTGKLKRRGLEPGAQKVYFSGRIGKKKLKPGKYRALLTAYNNVGASKTVRMGFKVVKR